MVPTAWKNSDRRLTPICLCVRTTRRSTKPISTKMTPAQRQAIKVADSCANAGKAGRGLPSCITPTRDARAATCPPPLKLESFFFPPFHMRDARYTHHKPLVAVLMSNSASVFCVFCVFTPSVAVVGPLLWATMTLKPGRSKKYGSCAFVGNAGSLAARPRAQGFGRAIDSHDSVFRFNYALTTASWGPWWGGASSTPA